MDTLDIAYDYYITESLYLLIPGISVIVVLLVAYFALRCYANKTEKKDE